MLKGFFKKDEENGSELQREKQYVLEGQDEEIEEAMSLLAEDGKVELDETMEEINEAVKEAAKTSLRDIKLMEEGRCPSCGHKTNQFLFTTVCANCGWFSHISPEEGQSIIHLKNGSTIECGTTFDTKDYYILGITDGVVRAKVSKDNVEFIEFKWTDEEVHKKRKARMVVQAAVDSWTEKPLTEYDNEPILVYASFGNLQERYVFGSKENAEAFKKQYPVRVHKNCYERPCVDCDLCIKKYSGEDETIYKKMIEEPV
ncbi:MAG: hypothetical protein CME19_01085 [Gemmatimonadetes bacterium]|nr:hypothetical protein [Gemmatimonadota bacterium]